MTDTWTWATVTQASPLRIKVDGDTTALDATTDDLVGSLAVLYRVRVHLHSDGIIVTGLQGGVVGTPEATAATANTLALRDANARIKAADGVAADDVATVSQLDGAVTKLPTAMASGSASFASLATGAYVDTVVTFPSGRFAVAPIVSITSGNGWVVAEMNAVSSTQFTCRMKNHYTGTSGASTFYWIAVQD